MRALRPYADLLASSNAFMMTAYPHTAYLNTVAPSKPTSMKHTKSVTPKSTSFTAQ